MASKSDSKNSKRQLLLLEGKRNRLAMIAAALIQTGDQPPLDAKEFANWQGALAKKALGIVDRLDLAAHGGMEPPT